MSPIPPYTPGGGGGGGNTPDPDLPPVMHVTYDASQDKATFTSAADLSATTNLTLYGGTAGGGFYYANPLNPGNFTIVDEHTIEITDAIATVFGQPFQMNYAMAFDDDALRPLAMYSGESLFFVPTPLVDDVTSFTVGGIQIDGTNLSSADAVRFVGDNNLDATIYSPFGANSGFNSPYPQTQIPQWNSAQIQIVSNALAAHSGDTVTHVEIRDYKGDILLGIDTNVVIL